MGNRQRQELDYEYQDDELDHLDMDFAFEDEDLDSYLSAYESKSAKRGRKTRNTQESNVHRLPVDWQDFDYSDEDWDND